MANKYIMMDGQKSVSLTSEAGWNYFTGYPNTTTNEQYAKVAAAFRAYNIKANTVANMPFALYKGKDEFDTSATWENKVKFLPNPSELLRLAVLSLISTNTAYNLRTTDALGYKTKGLYHAVAYTFTPETNPINGNLLRITRTVGTTQEHYTPDDPRLVRLWRMDHTTEVLPSANTEAKAIMSAAGQVLYADQWIQHFYQRGGIAPTLIAMKGLISQEDKDKREKSWTDWLLGLGKYVNRVARIFNAETMDVKQMGSSVTDLKNNEVYRQALANIAMGTGMPLSMLLSNSANYATADAEKMTWYESEIIPLCNWIAYEYNRQVWEPLGLRMEFKPETLDLFQQDENTTAANMSTFIDFLNKCGSAEIAIETARSFGAELTDGLIAAIKKHFADKEANKPVPVAPVIDTPPVNVLPVEVAPAKWIPSLEQLSEMKTWQTFALRKLKKGLPLDFPFEVRTLPVEFAARTREALSTAQTEADIKAAFVFDDIPEQTPTNDIMELAKAINKLAEK